MNKKIQFIICRKAATKLLSIWWFWILVIVAVGVITATYMFYSGGVDTRQVESEILAMKILDCFIERDKIKFVFNPDSDFDLFGECSLNPDVLNNGNYFIKITLSSVEKTYGDVSFEKNCIMAQGLTARHFPRCTEMEIGDFKVLAGSNYRGGKND